MEGERRGTWITNQEWGVTEEISHGQKPVGAAEENSHGRKPVEKESAVVSF
jgi:hypothetical protein